MPDDAHDEHDETAETSAPIVGDVDVVAADEPVERIATGVDDAELRRAVEAIVMVADEPVSPQLLGELLEVGSVRAEELCAELAALYEEERRGFTLVRIAGGYRFQSHPDLATYVERFVLDGQASRLSAAAMETLAIVAYKQPISRAQVAQIRGVNVDAVMRTLVQRGYVTEVAVDPGPGQASLFGTTRLFLESLGLDSVADLPPLGDFVPGADVMEVLEANLRIDDASGRSVRGGMPSTTAGLGDATDDAAS